MMSPVCVKHLGIHHYMLLPPERRRLVTRAKRYTVSKNTNLVTCESVCLCSSARDRGQAVKVDFLAWSRGQGQFWTVKILDRGHGWNYMVHGSDHPLYIP